VKGELKMSSSILIENIKKSLGGREILKGVSFAVEKGDIFGFLGRNGAGKTTTIRTLLGLYHVDSGKASIMGCDVSSDESRKNVGFVLDGDGLYDSMSAEANLAYYQRIYGKPVDKKQIARVLGLVGLSDRAKDKAGTFSKGMRQKLALAKALVHNPEVLILDEPTSGLDPTAQIEFRNIMVNIAQNEHKTVLLSSHNLDEVQRICNRIALLNNGEIKLYGKLDELRQQMGKDTVVVQTSNVVSDAIFQKLKNMKEFGLKERNGNSLVFIPTRNMKTQDIIVVLSNEGVEVEEFTKNEASLEEMYSSIVREV
jgi:ABC-2 type transport system ATP-binding protein